MELYLIRHPRVTINAGICYGQSDVPLADTFVTDIHGLKLCIPESFDVVMTSPLLRCSTVAQFFAARKIIRDARLLELNFGAWELKRWDDIPVEQLNAWAEDVEHFRIPEGETVHELLHRVACCMTSIKALQDVKTLGVFTHAGVIRCWLAHCAQLSLQEALQLQIDYASVSKLVVRDGRMHIAYINKRSGDVHGL